MSAPALWCVGPGSVEIRPAPLGDGVLVETVFTGISRGTERLVFEGRVPETEYERMRGPAQAGDFPFPVRYGYSAVGRVAEGEKSGQLVFGLFGHQTSFRLPSDMLFALPGGVEAKRAILAANMETALNIVWDSGAGLGDKIVVIGAGVVGSLTAYLLAQIPGTEVTLVDLNPQRARIAEVLGSGFASPNQAPSPCDVVINTSGSESGLVRALELAGPEATVVEASWHGDKTVTLPLGQSFHSQRLRIVSSQVGHVPPTRAPRWTSARRMSKALELLTDDRLDVLVSGETPFADLPAKYGTIVTNPETLCHRVVYDTV